LPVLRVVLAEDHGVVREGLKRLIDAEGDMEVVGEAAQTDAILDVVKQSKPDMVLLDVTMPGGDSLAEIRRLKRARPGLRVIVLTMHEEGNVVRQAVVAGADGYVVKRVPAADLLEAMRAVIDGRLRIDVTVGDGDLRVLLEDRAEPSAIGRLSRREREVLRLIASGCTNQEAAEVLGVSVKTAESYRARLARKLGAGGRTDLVRIALEAGLLDLDGRRR
jgi:two-component system, NarL family, response regulator NreC